MPSLRMTVNADKWMDEHTEGKLDAAVHSIVSRTNWLTGQLIKSTCVPVYCAKL